MTSDAEFVSTGALPRPELVQSLVEDAYERHRTNRQGESSDVYPALTRVSPDLFGICVVANNGTTYVAGDSEHEFSIMSVSKPFVFALVCELLGPQEARERLGVNSTGLPFNSLTAVERGDAGRTNPMVNAGAIATTSLVPGEGGESKWTAIRQGLSAFAGRDLSLNAEIYESASQTNQRNESIAHLLESYGRLDGDPVDALELYTKQCSLNVSAKDLAAMGATLADAGVNPLTGARVLGADACRRTLAVMATAGLYETSGDWLYDVGLPGKSGIGGGIVTVAPGKGGLGTYSPRLDGAGNSVRGQLVAAELSHTLGLDVFVSQVES